MALRGVGRPGWWVAPRLWRRPIELAALAVALVSCCGCEGCAGARRAPREDLSRFLARSLELEGARHGYRVFLPDGYTGGRSWPILLFLHGSGERGSDNVRQVGIGLGPMLRRDSARFPMIVVFPQCRAGGQWFGAMERLALAALEQATAEFHGDRLRTYLTGVSIGGTGAWYLARHPGVFAAVVPVSGEILDPKDDPFPDLTPDIERLVSSHDPYSSLAGLIGDTPVWVFHGGFDDEIPVAEARAMVAALRARGGRPLYTEYPYAGHAIWDQVYDDPRLPGWLLAQHREALRSGR